MPQKACGEGGQRIRVGVRRQGMLDDQTVGADYGKTGHFRPFGEALDQVPEHAGNVGFTNAEVKKNRWVDPFRGGS
jgi:hypothetical protein